MTEKVLYFLTNLVSLNALPAIIVRRQDALRDLYSVTAESSSAVRSVHF